MVTTTEFVERAFAELSGRPEDDQRLLLLALLDECVIRLGGCPCELLAAQYGVSTVNVLVCKQPSLAKPKHVVVSLVTDREGREDSPLCDTVREALSHVHDG